jgi:excisionase family DNA binding protein
MNNTERSAKAAPASEFESLKRLAQLTGKTYRTIHRATRAGKIRVVRFGGSVMVPRREVERILEHGWR